MLSLIGSIQPDPFSPDHIPDRSIISTTINQRQRPQRASESEAAVEDIIMPDGEMEAGSDDDVDAFGALGRMGDEAERKAEAEKKQKRKRKRREEKAAAETKKVDSPKPAGGEGGVQKMWEDLCLS